MQIRGAAPDEWVLKRDSTPLGESKYEIESHDREQESEKSAAAETGGAAREGGIR